MVAWGPCPYDFCCQCGKLIDVHDCAQCDDCDKVFCWECEAVAMHEGFVLCGDCFCKADTLPMWLCWLFEKPR